MYDVQGGNHLIRYICRDVAGVVFDLNGIVLIGFIARFSSLSLVIWRRLFLTRGGVRTKSTERIATGSNRKKEKKNKKKCRDGNRGVSKKPEVGTILRPRLFCILETKQGYVISSVTQLLRHPIRVALTCHGLCIEYRKLSCMHRI